MPIINDTIRLTFYFNDVAENPVDVANVKVKFYDSKRAQIGETMNLTDEHKLTAGVFRIDYVVPDGNGNITVEYSGEFEDEIYLHREEFERVWVKTKGNKYSF